MASDIWNWAAVVLGLDADGTSFIPLYWALPSRVVTSYDFAVNPFVFLWGALIVSFVAVWAFVKTKRWAWVDAACFIWGGAFRRHAVRGRLAGGGVDGLDAPDAVRGTDDV